MYLQKFSVRIAVAILLISATSFATIRVAIPNKVKNLDPRKVSIAQERFMLPLIYESLFLISEDGQIQNQIARAWAFDEKKHQFKVTISDNHYFSDGTKLTRADVIFSFVEFCKAGNSDSKILSLTGACEMPVLVDKTDSSSFSFRISDSPNDFLFKIGSGRFSIFKTGKTGIAIGSGQFKIQSAVETLIKLDANSFYPMDKQSRSFEFIYVPEDSLQTNLSEKSIDIATMYLNSTVSELNVSPYKVVSYSPVITETLVLNESKVPFDSLKFRTAFYAEISGNPLFLKCKKGSVPANGLIPSGIGGSIANDSNKPSSVGIEINRLKHSKLITFVRHRSRQNVCEEKVISEAGKKFNLRIEFRYLDDYAKLMKIYSDKSADGIVELYVFNRDASVLLSRLIPGTSPPIFYYTDAKIARLLEKASKENLLRNRFQYFRDVVESVKQRAIAIPLYYESHTNILRSCFYEGSGELKPNPNSFLFLLALPSSNTCTSEDEKR